MHRLEDTEVRQFEAIMLAIRPDWAPHNPGAKLQHANTSGFRFAADYPHMIRALAVYATLPDAYGNPFGRGPEGYTRAGHHWTSTAPQDFDKPRSKPCEEHPEFEGDTCRCCISEHKGPERRPESMIGRRWNPGGRVIPGDAADFQARWAQIRATAATLATDTKRHTPNLPAQDVTE